MPRNGWDLRTTYNKKFNTEISKAKIIQLAVEATVTESGKKINRLEYAEENTKKEENNFTSLRKDQKNLKDNKTILRNSGYRPLR